MGTISWHEQTSKISTAQAFSIFSPNLKHYTLPIPMILNSHNAFYSGSESSSTINQTQLVIIDSHVEAIALLLQAIKPEYRVEILDPDREGIAQISEILSHHTQIKSLHLVSHGQPGTLQLGKQWVSRTSLLENALTVLGWANAFAANANILLYGCEVAQGRQGQQFISILSELTGANIAASTTKVGSATKGGNWQLDSAPQTPTYFYHPSLIDLYPGTFSATSGNDSLSGTNIDESIDGLQGNDTLLGLDGDDTLLGNLDDDLLIGGNGEDSLNGGSGNDSLQGGANNDVINGGNGIDTAIYSEYSTALNINISDQFNGSATTSISDTIEKDQLISIENIMGGSSNDTIVGNDVENQLVGGAGDDSLTGGQGNDVLDGGTGLDTAVFSGNYADFTIIWDGTTATVTNKADSSQDSLTNIGKLQFNDRVIYLAGTDDYANAGNVYEDAGISSGDAIFSAPIIGSYTDTTANDTFNDITGSLSSVSDASYGIVSGEGTVTSLTGAYGTLSIDSTGAYTYTPNDVAIEGIKTDQTESFVLQITKDGAIAQQTLIINLTGANDTPIITGLATGTISEDDPFKTASGDLNVTDADDSGVVFAANDFTGDFGSLSINEQGQWTYTLTEDVQSLPQSTSVTDTFEIASSSGGATQTITITITGENDAATTGGSGSGTVGEDGMLTTTGSLSITDPDTGESEFVPDTQPGAYGTFTIGADGEWSYSLSNETPIVQSLAADETVTDTFSVGSKDGSTQELVTITITGANDLPLISGDTTGGVTEDVDVVSETNLSTSGDLLITDPDSDSNRQFAVISHESGSNSYGQFSITANGAWTYAVANANVQFLGAGDTVTDSYTFMTDDGEASETVTVTITGSNDAAIIGNPPNATVTEDTATPNLVTSGLLALADVDQHEQSFKTVTTGAETNLSSSSLTLDADGNYTFSVANTDVQYLGAGESKTETFTVETVDGDTKSINFTVNGINDAPVITSTTADAQGSVTEAGHADDGTVFAGSPSISGTLTATDADSSATKTWSIAGTGTYGGITIDAATGQWTYTLDDTKTATQLLREGTTATETFTATVKDDKNAIATQTVTVTINGTNDRPSLTGVPSSFRGTEDTSFTLTKTQLLQGYTDPDSGETATLEVSGLTSTAGTFASQDGGLTYTFTPNANFNGNATFDYKVVDENGATSTLASRSVVIDPVNDAPTRTVATVSLAAINEDATNPNGATVNSLFASAFSDVKDDQSANDGSEANPFTGIFITKTAATPGQGEWQWYDSIGKSWEPISAISAPFGLFLGLTSKLRFVPAPNFAGMPGGLSVRLVESADYREGWFTSLSGEVNLDTSSVGTTANTVTLNTTVNNVDDPTTITGAKTGKIKEDTLTSAIGQLTVSDLDPGEINFMEVNQAEGDNGYGVFSMTANGTWLYALDNSLDAVQALKPTSTPLTDSYTFTTTGGATQTVTISIFGTNDAPISVADFDTAEEAGGLHNTELGLDPTGNVLDNDTDVDADETKTITGFSFGTTMGAVGNALAGRYGALTLQSNGTYTYAVNNSNTRVQALTGPGMSLTEMFRYTMVDQAGRASSNHLTITITGANDSAVITGTTSGMVREDGPLSATSAKGNLNAVDVDNPKDAWSVVSSNLSNEQYGTYSLTADGIWHYTLDNTNPEVQALKTGEFLTDTITATTIDGTPQTVTITIAGTNDLAFISGDLTGSIREDDNTNIVSDSISVIDGDVGENSFQPLSNVNGSYGSLNLTTQGNWTYTLDNTKSSVQSLANGTSVTDSFTVASIDGSATHTVTVTIHGTNDAPTVNTPIADQSVNERTVFNFALPSQTFRDIDGDTLTYSVTGMPSWLSFNNGTFVGNPTRSHVGSYSISVSASDGIGSISDTFTLTVNATINEVTGNSGADMLSATAQEDNLDGAAGNDTLFATISNLAQNDTLKGGNDFDTLVIDGAGSSTLTVDVSAANQVTGITGATFSSFEAFNFSDYGGQINFLGTSANDSVSGGQGNDTFEGADGIDILAGGRGDDIYYVNNALDIVHESAVNGNDVIFASTSYTLISGQEIESLTLTGTNANSATGNEFRNLIAGNDADNILRGLDGIDTLIGNEGNDVYVLDSLDDIIVETGTSTGDRVNASVSFSLANLNTIETLLLTGTDAINGTGHELQDRIFGNQANNLLFGEGGMDTLTGKEGDDSLQGGADNDLLIGGLGNDVLTGGIGRDRFLFNNSTEGLDTITDFSSSQSDKVQVSISGFGLSTSSNSTLASSAFALSTGAITASTRFIYNASTGLLSFDADGSGSTAAKGFVNIGPSMTFSNTDIILAA
jgi:VCBS repeat-containing protein